MDSFESTDEMGVIIEMSGASNTPSQSSCCKRWYNIFALLLLVAIACFFLGMTVKSIEDKPHEGKTSAQTLLKIDTYKLRIDPDVTECEEPVCVMCTAQVPWSQNIADAREYYPCEPNLHPRVIDGCFLCGGNCLSFADLENIVNVSGGWTNECNGALKIDCCTLSLMGNHSQICGPGGNYSCHGNDPMPVCKCPYGKEGDRCQNDAKTAVNCSCFAYPFCGQEKLVDCEMENKRPGTSQCHMTAERDGQTFNCICDTPSGRTDSGVDTCSVPNTKPLTNESRELSYSLPLIMIVMINILRKVDKT